MSEMFKTLHELKETNVPAMPNNSAANPIIIAVDGPAGSGKSSICNAVCRELGLTYVNTGFLYRAIAYLCHHRSIDTSDTPELRELIREFASDMTWQPKTGSVIFAGTDISPQLYTDEAGRLASAVATSPLVRQELLPLQRRLAQEVRTGSIVDGRDIGTVVFPDADIKVFMTASLAVRAERRLKQLDSASPETIESIQASIAKRDAQDSERGHAPLKRADDAILLDTSDMSAEESRLALIKIIKAGLKERGSVKTLDFH